MNNAHYFHLISALPQFAVVYYALRLNRRFGVARVGWLLAAGFLLLALLYLLFFSEPFRSYPAVEMKMDIAYALASLFLLVIMVFMEVFLKERARFQEAELKSQAELKIRVEEQTAELIKANEQLEATTADLRLKISEQQRMREQMERTHRELLTVTRKAGMSEVATGVLHNVGNVLNSVNVSAGLLADHLRQSKVVYLSRVAQLFHEHSADLAGFITRDDKGKQLPAYLIQLARHLENEHVLLIKETDFIRSKVEHIKEIVATQQSYGKVSGVAERVRITDVMDDVLQIHAAELAAHAIQVRREYAPMLPDMIVDKHKVLQILLNLVSNAKHACADSRRDGKLVAVRVTNGDDKVRITIGDNGVGIPPANLTKIFNHGFTTRKKNGHGFGLHSGALAAREIGGQLTARSEGPDKGATFTLELPLKPAQG